MSASAENTPPEDAPAAAPQPGAALPLVADAPTAAPHTSAAEAGDAGAPPVAAPPAAEAAAPSDAVAANAAPADADADADADVEAGADGEAGAADADADAGAVATAADAGADAAPTAAAAPPALAAVPELAPAACAAALAERFPALFGSPRALPLKLRIQADIQTRAPGVFSKKSLSIFLHRHTTSTAYLRALVNTPTRHDLDGLPAGEVAEEHRAAATAEVERRRAIVDARRQAERDAQRQAARAAQRAAAGAAQGAGPGAQATLPAAPAGASRAGRHDAPRRPSHAGEHAARAQGRRGPPHPRAAPISPPMAPPHDALAATDAPSPHAADRRPATAVATAADLAQHQTARPPAPQFSPAEMEARRERAALLRAFEGSTLTRANFCVLKRISEADLQAQLALAGQERRAQEPRLEPRPEQGADRGAWRNEGGVRPDRGAGGSSRGARAPQGRPPGKPPR